MGTGRLPTPWYPSWAVPGAPGAELGRPFTRPWPRREKYPAARRPQGQAACIGPGGPGPIRPQRLQLRPPSAGDRALFPGTAALPAAAGAAGLLWNRARDRWQRTSISANYIYVHTTHLPWAVDTNLLAWSPDRHRHRGGWPSDQRPAFPGLGCGAMRRQSWPLLRRPNPHHPAEQPVSIDRRSGLQRRHSGGEKALRPNP